MESAIEKGRNLITRVRERDILELIETILVYKLPDINREEIEKMFGLSDLKRTRVYREALEEGKQEGRPGGELQAKLSAIPRLAALGLNAQRIATALELDIERVKEVLEYRPR